MSNRVRDIPDELLDILEELVIYEEERKPQEDNRPYLELEYLKDRAYDYRKNIESEEDESPTIIHIQL